MYSVPEESIRPVAELTYEVNEMRHRRGGILQEEDIEVAISKLTKAYELLLAAI